MSYPYMALKRHLLGCGNDAAAAEAKEAANADALVAIAAAHGVDISALKTPEPEAVFQSLEEVLGIDGAAKLREEAAARTEPTREEPPPFDAPACAGEWCAALRRAVGDDIYELCAGVVALPLAELERARAHGVAGTAAGAANGEWVEQLRAMGLAANPSDAMGKALTAEEAEATIARLLTKTMAYSTPVLEAALAGRWASSFVAGCTGVGADAAFFTLCSEFQGGCPTDATFEDGVVAVLGDAGDGSGRLACVWVSDED